MKKSNLKFCLLIVLVAGATLANGFDIKPSYDGKALMRGIFFKDGNPDLIPFFNDTQSELKKKDSEYLLIQETILSRMEEKKPKLYEDFKSKITSGNHLEIRDALDEYGMLLKLSAEEIYGNQLEAGLKKKQPNPDVKVVNGNGGVFASSPKVETSELGLFITSTIAIVASEYIYLVNSYYEAVDVYDDRPALASAKKGLYKEELVNWIALNLSA